MLPTRFFVLSQIMWLLLFCMFSECGNKLINTISHHNADKQNILGLSHTYIILGDS
jgi:hypothetical protein